MNTVYYFILFLIVGFIAEMIDGTLGMAYGVSSNTVLRSFGIPSAVSSACVHVSEIFTTLVSGISHLVLKNVHKQLFFKLLVPGIIGGIIGAYLLSEFDSAILNIIIDVYLIVMGIVIFSKTFKKPKEPREFGAYVYPLGLAGGFTDAMGGGGWGPIVTSTLIASGHDTKKTIGTVNTVEFFVTIAETTTFVVLIQDFQQYLVPILGLIVGGIVAAPLGALICKKLDVKKLFAVVGVLVILVNVYKLLQHAGIL